MGPGETCGEPSTVTVPSKLKDKPDTMNYLVMGPWFHSQINREGRALGSHSPGPPTPQPSGVVMCSLPFFNQYLKPGGPPPSDAGGLHLRHRRRSLGRAQGFPPRVVSRAVLWRRGRSISGAAGGLSFVPPAEASAAKFDEYVSDPAKPVPYRPRPIDDADEMGWRTWLVTDQRFVDGRPRCSDLRDRASQGADEVIRRAGCASCGLNHGY